MGFYNITDLTNDYFKYEVVTNVERVTEENFTFPAVTICKSNIVERHYYKNNTIVNKENVTDLSMKNFIGYSFFKETSNNITDQLEFFRLPQYGYICTRFNGVSNHNLENQLVKVNTTNEPFYIEIIHKYFQPINENEYFNYTLSINQPFTIFIEDNYLNSYYGKFSLMKNGIEHYISMVKSESEEKLDDPYSKCKKSTNNQRYLQNNCIESCIYSKIGRKFNCTFNGLFKINDLQVCKFNISDFVFFNQIKEEVFKDCNKECPIECKSMKFSSQVSEWEPIKFGSQVSTNQSDVNQMSTRFAFFLSDLSFLKITQIPKTSFFSFISADIGGALGLFMGASALNFIEIFEFIVDISFIYFGY